MTIEKKRFESTIDYSLLSPSSASSSTPKFIFNQKINHQTPGWKFHVSFQKFGPEAEINKKLTSNVENIIAADQNLAQMTGKGAINVLLGVGELEIHVSIDGDKITLV